jgi:ribonuclease Z
MSTALNVVFLGTSGSMPTNDRGSSSVVVKIERGLIMFDCGEGTQRQMVRARIGFRREMKILVSHMHGDHVLGLPGLFQTMGLLGREKPLDLFGPVGIIDFVKSFSETLGGPTFPVIIHEITGSGKIYEDDRVELFSIKSSHNVDSYSYGLFEKPRPGRFHPDKAEALGVPRGRLWHRLQHNESVNIGERIIKPEEVTDAMRPGVKIIYSGDTKPFDGLVKFAKGADLLIHEATFSEELTERAEEDGHSTTVQAAEIAKKAQVKRLVLTHISSRYPEPSFLLDEAKKIFDNVIVAEDLMELEVSKSK